MHVILYIYRFIYAFSTVNKYLSYVYLFDARYTRHTYLSTEEVLIAISQHCTSQQIEQVQCQPVVNLGMDPNSLKILGQFFSGVSAMSCNGTFATR